MRKLFKYGLFLGSLLFALLLLFCKAIPNINPYELSFVGILSFFVPVLVIVNILFLIVWLISRKYLLALIPFIALILSWNIYSSLFGLNFFQKHSFEKSINAISVMSYNVRLLNLYNWNRDKNTREKIISLFKKYNPTILCLQEFYNGNDSIGVNNISEIMKICDYKYFATCYINTNKRGNWGSIVFSHIPIVNTHNYDIDVYGNNLLQQVDFIFKNEKISIFNVHLKSNKFSSTETEAIVNSEKENLKMQSWNIFRKLEKNAINRGLEAALVSNIISKTKNKTIVCGDFNDLPSSYVYFKMKQKLKDSFLEQGLGFGNTYISKIPLLRIDYILHSETIKGIGFKKIKVNYSDHYPLLVNLKI